MKAELYAKISAITTVLFGCGAALSTAAEALDSGRVSAQEFTTEMRRIERKLAVSYDELRMIRFPSMAKQRNHTRLIVGVTAMRQAVAAATEAAMTGNDALWRKVTENAERSARAMTNHLRAFAEGRRG